MFLRTAEKSEFEESKRHQDMTQDMPVPRAVIERKLSKSQFRQTLVTAAVVGLFTAASTALFQPARISLRDNFLAGLVIGTVLPVLYLSASAVVQDRFKRQRRRYALSVVATAAILFAATFIVMIPFGLFFFPDDLFTPKMLTFGVSIASFFALLVSITSTITRFTGKSVVKDVYLGRYHLPKLEERIFLFVDIKSSSALAEEVGSAAFFDMVNEFHHTLETYARYFGGAIYKYLGDGEIIVWPVEHADQALLMLINFDHEFDVTRAKILSKHGKEVVFTSGLHLGPCMVGEIGFERKEIGYWGDTVNTAQRIQDACKRFTTNMLVSDALVSRLSQGVRGALLLERVDDVSLRGKNNLVTLYKVGRSPPP